MTKVLYPGSFDPITKGHMNVIKQASELFDEVVIGILVNPNKKNYLFDLEVRERMINEIYKDYPNIKVVVSKEPSIDVALNNNCKAIVRGLRGLSDYDYEVQLASINKELSDNKINTVCLFADKEYQFISSSMVKEIYSINKPIDNYVDPVVLKEFKWIKK